MHKRLNLNQKILVNLLCLILLALMTVTIAALYVSSERNFHWWIDWYNATAYIATTFRDSPSEAIKLILDSLAYERNRLYTLPLIPFILIFGKSRLVYEIGLALVYLLPLTLVMGAIATQLIPVYRQLVFWSTAFLTLLIPVSWMPTLIGIPDTGGAFFVALAAFLYLQDVELSKWWRIASIGVAMGLAVVVRRHFVYGDIALLCAITCQSLLFFSAQVRQKQQIPWRSLLSMGGRIGFIGAVTFATLWAIAPQFTYQALTTNYRTLYASWSLPFKDMVNLYAAFYGWVTWLLVAIGFSAGIITRAVAWPRASLIGLWGIFSMILWLVVLRYANVFYSLHVTPLIAIGLVASIWTIWSRLTGKVRTVMLSVVGCYLVSNLVMGLTPLGTFDNAFRPLFALNMPPLVRKDYDEVVRLVNYLRQIAPHEEPIYVVGYQRLHLNLSMVKAAERALYEPEDRILNILLSPQVDSQDAYPLETLLQAQYVVIPNPLPDYPADLTKAVAVGEWLPNKELDVVQVVFDAFAQNWEIALDFKRLPVQFTLAGDARVSIYQRTRPTSLATAARTLAAMQQQIGSRPGGQLDWMVFQQQLPESLVTKNLDNTYELATEHSQGVREVSLSGANILEKADDTNQSTTSFLYLGSLPEEVTVTGKVKFPDTPCVPLSLRLAMLDLDGKILSSTTTTQKQYFPDDLSNFQLSIRGQNPAYLMLDVVSYDRDDAINSCKIDINSLTVSPQKSLSR
ncbi:MAG TPA: hypothetical protein DDZ80_29605 [Cyanobacteria bacterium UBA8803]|nr:hypothetical protein [Cyanobacteria bacterium UBA9273]HBL62399.1 hypothetical protein [Cyanobacteria bacterium UBA8803]